MSIQKQNKQRILPNVNFKNFAQSLSEIVEKARAATREEAENKRHALVMHTKFGYKDIKSYLRAQAKKGHSSTQFIKATKVYDYEFCRLTLVDLLKKDGFEIINGVIGWRNP
jgi:hypothetical protein